MALQKNRLKYAAAIIERADHHYLIARPATGSEVERLWVFPRGPVRPGEAPEAAIRRIAKADLGVALEVVVGQPPLVMKVDGEEAVLRYFFCGIVSGEPRAGAVRFNPGSGAGAGRPGPTSAEGPYCEVRWVSKGHLREYDFDTAAQPVSEWLLDQA